MHIAFVIPDVKGGGAQKMMINLANEFAARNFRVDLVLFNKEGTYLDNINDNVTIHNFNKPRTAASISSLKNYIKQEEPDILISALFHVNIATIIARLLCGKTKTRLIVSERNHLSCRLSEMPFLQRFLLMRSVKFLYPYADKIIGISEGVRKDLLELIKPKERSFIKTIYNPVITEEFDQMLEQEVRSVFKDDDSLKLVTSGRLVLQKDYPTLLKALAIYNEKYGSAQLAILGDGILKQEMEILAKTLNVSDKVYFLGFVENSLAHMRQADMFVISSAWEGFCNVIVEALYCGLKVVSTDCRSGPAEILEYGQYGGLVDVGDAHEFASRIDDINREEYYPDHQKRRALEFTAPKKADEFLEVFKEVIHA